MATALAGLGPAIIAMFRLDSTPVVEIERKTVDLEEIINKSLAGEREKIKPTKEDNDKFGWVTKDNNPIHYSIEKARELGFDNVPLRGAHVAAYGEQFIERVVEKLKEYLGADIKVIGQDNKFRGPMYIDDKTLWQVTGFKQAEDEIKLEVSGKTKDREIVGITARLGKNYVQVNEPGVPIYQQNYLFEKEHLDEFCKCVGGENNGIMPNSMPKALVPAALLSLLEQKTSTMEGANLSMNFDYINRAQLGKLQVEIYNPRTPRSQKRKDKEGNLVLKDGQPIADYLYRFNALVKQEDTPITYGTIVSTAPVLIEF